jgi:hypothetical protein
MCLISKTLAVTCSLDRAEADQVSSSRRPCATIAGTQNMQAIRMVALQLHIGIGFAHRSRSWTVFSSARRAI